MIAFIVATKKGELLSSLLENADEKKPADNFLDFMSAVRRMLFCERVLYM